MTIAVQVFRPKTLFTTKQKRNILEIGFIVEIILIGLIANFCFTFNLSMIDYVYKIIWRISYQFWFTWQIKMAFTGVCHHCGSVLKTRWGFKKHVQAHENKAPFKCCGKSYQERRTLIMHRFVQLCLLIKVHLSCI
jgi:hypothetical protein